MSLWLLPPMEYVMWLLKLGLKRSCNFLLAHWNTFSGSPELPCGGLKSPNPPRWRSCVCTFHSEVPAESILFCYTCWGNERYGHQMIPGPSHSSHSQTSESLQPRSQTLWSRDKPFWCALIKCSLYYNSLFWCGWLHQISRTPEL